MLTMGEGNVMTSNNRFASPPQQPSSSSPGTIQNPNFNFIPFNSYSSIIPKEEHGMMSMMMMMGDGTVEEMMENGSAGGSFGSGSEQAEDPKFGNESDVNELHDDEQPPPAKKKRYHRHTNRQIQEMEALFKENPHPDDKQRKRLSAELGLKPRQVKFWFQNRRTQMKAQQDRNENVMLRAENDNLKSENCHLQAELRCLSCPSCGGPTVLGDIPFNEIHIENCRLREELDRLCCIASRYTGRPMQSMPPSQPLINPSPMLPHHQPSLELDMSVYAGNFPEQSCTDMMMLPPQDTACFFPDQTANNNNNNNMLLADEEKVIAMEFAVSCVQELTKMCDTEEPLWIKKKSDKIGGEILCLNEEEYMRLFPWPMENQNNKGDFLREASKANAVVIMNSITLVDAFLNADKWSEMFCSIVARAKTVQIISSGVSGASGSLLLVLSPLVPTREAYFLRYVEQNAETGNWAIVDFPIDSFHDQMQPMNTITHEYKRKPSGCIIQDMPNGYSQVKWVEHVEVDEKHVHETFAEYVKSGMAFGANRWLDVLQRQCERIASLMARNITDLGEARRNIMRLSQRLVKTFCVNISTAYGQSWTALSETTKDTVRITTRKMCEPGQPTGVVLCAVSTTWLPFSHHQVFDLIRDQHHQSLVASNSWHNVELMLQESCIDNSGSLIVYSTVDVDSIQQAMNGEDSSNIPILPLGFSIVPVNPPEGISVNSHSPPSCLLTVGIQVLASNVPTAKPNLSTVTTINNHLCATVNQITSALSNTITPVIASSADVSNQEVS
nr:homeobox protein [Arabidopsis thaliana]